MNSINLQDFTEEAAYQVQAVLETISRLGERIEVYDGERLVGTVLRGEVVEDDEPLPEGVEEGSPALGIDISLEKALDQFAKQVHAEEEAERLHAEQIQTTHG